MIRVLSLAAAVATLSLASCASMKKKDCSTCCDSKKPAAAQKACCDSKDKAKKGDACCEAGAAKPAKKK